MSDKMKEEENNKTEEPMLAKLSHRFKLRVPVEHLRKFLERVFWRQPLELDTVSLAVALHI